MADTSASARMSSSSATTPSDLTKLYERIVGLQERQKLLGMLASQSDTTWTSSDAIKLSLDSWIDHHSQINLDDMMQLATTAAQRPSLSLHNLYCKARIWQMRRLPEHDDEATRLAAAICDDICRLFD